MKRYGVLGERLSHTMSPQIHKMFFAEVNKFFGEYSNRIDATYEVVEIARHDFADCKKTLLAFDGLNITVPYKQDIMQFLDEIDEEAKKIGAVNTIVNKGGKLLGCNTDAFGFGYLLDSNKLNVQDKVVAVLGSGGASKAVVYSLIEKRAKTILIVSRNPKCAYKQFLHFGSNMICESEIEDNNLSKSLYKIGVKNTIIECISYGEMQYMNGYLIINATPVGMYPNVDESPVDMTTVEKFENVCDIIYNPSVTKLCSFGLSLYHNNIAESHCQSKEDAITCNGLAMLVAQAIKSEEHWGNGLDMLLGQLINAGDCFCNGLIFGVIINKIFNAVSVNYFLNNNDKNKNNLIFLSGMMGCGKSSVGALLAKELDMQFIDLDEYIVKRTNKTISQMFEIGEEHFRCQETESLFDLVKNTKKAVVALGGGALTKARNCGMLKMAGITIFVDRSLENIKSTIDQQSRPLIKDDIKKLDELYNKRIDTYRRSCNFIVENNATAEECVAKICEELKKNKAEN